MVPGLVSHLDIQWQQTAPSTRTIRCSAASGTFTRPGSTSCSARAGTRPTPRSASASASPPSRSELALLCGRDDTTGQRRPADPARGHHRRGLARGGRADPGRGRRQPLRRPAGARDLAGDAGGGPARPSRRDHRLPRRTRAAGLDARQLHRARQGRRPRRRGQLRDPAVRLRALAAATRSPGSSTGCAGTRLRGPRPSPPSSRTPTPATSRASACSTSGCRAARSS